MDNYIYDRDDGRIHVNYSTLKRCNTGGAERVVLERLGLIQAYSSDEMSFGIERHKLWEEESLKTHNIPVCFEYELNKLHIPRDLLLSHIEQSMSVEIFPNVVLHGRADSISTVGKTIFDNKTTTGVAKQFASSDQLLVYMFLCWKLGIPINRGVRLVELWSKDHKRILGYDSYEKQFSLADISIAKQWLADRAEILVTAIEVVKASLDRI